MCPIRFLGFGTDARKLGSIAAACGRRAIFFALACTSSRLGLQLQHQLSSRQQNAIDTMRSLNTIRNPRMLGLFARSRRNGISQSRWNSTQPPSPEPNQTSPHVCFSSRVRKYTANRCLGWLLQDIRAPHSQSSPYGHVYISSSILGVGKTRKG
jgi:hypothetical protein